MNQLPKRNQPKWCPVSNAGRPAANHAAELYDGLPLSSKFRPDQLSSKLYERYATELVDNREFDPSQSEGPVPQDIFHKPRLYTAEERRRRDASRWTVVQGILAPLQFAVFLVSAGLVVRYLATGDGLTAATLSIVIKTVVLYLIMITGSLWEHDVYGRYLFAPAFFWEDILSMLVLGLHTAYLAALATGVLESRGQMCLALAAYATYLVNATQFLLKLRDARLGAEAAKTAAAVVSFAP
jgi:3-vinyl bacteriochlorophyllide hydratase